MKKLLLISLMLPSISLASVKGIGEYFYGPEISENMACNFAEEKAKEDALQKYVGELIESNIKEICSNEKCEQIRETYNTIVGKIKNINNKQIEKTIEEGSRVCTVTIDADVEILKNTTRIKVNFFRPIVKENEEINFEVLVNKVGKLVILNQFDEKYEKIYEIDIVEIDKSIIIPNNSKFIAVLPKDKHQSIEKLAFLFFSVDRKVKSSYNEYEMKNFIGSIPIENRDVVYRYFQILR